MVESRHLISLKEGENATISFQFDFVEDIDFQIRIGSRDAFYRQNEIYESGLSESQAERFDVRLIEPVPNYMIVVHLAIKEVHREDAGTYTCAMYKHGEILSDSIKKLGVTVEYPPGKARCWPHNHFTDTNNQVWETMKCVSLVGSKIIQVQIECYQNGERVPPSSSPIQNETHLMQNVWIKKTIRIFCCTSSIEEPKGRCKCNDYIWDPTDKKEMPSGLEPCSSGTPETISISNQNNQKTIDPTIQYNAETENEAIDKNPYSSQPNLILSIFIIVSIILLIMIIILCRRIMNYIFWRCDRGLRDSGNEGSGKCKIKPVNV